MEGSINTSGVDEGSGLGEGGRGLGVEGVVRNDTVGRGVVGNENVERETGVFVGIALCVSASSVFTVDMAVSIISASLTVGVDWTLLQEASIPVARTKEINGLPKMFILPLSLMIYKETLNASRLFQGCAIRVGQRLEHTENLYHTVKQ